MISQIFVNNWINLYSKIFINQFTARSFLKNEDTKKINEKIKETLRNFYS